MADKHEQDPNNKAKGLPEHFPNLELPNSHQPDPLDEPIEVVEVVEDAVEIADEDVVEVMDEEVVEVVEEAEPADAELVQDVVEVAEVEPPLAPAVAAAELAEDIEQTLTAAKALGAIEPPVPPKSTAGESDDALEITDIVEVLPSSSHIMQAPLVEEAQAEVIEEALEASAIAKPPSAPEPHADSGHGPGHNEGEQAEDVVVDFEEVLVEGESEIDLGRRVGSKGERPSGVDIIAEALESGVDLGHAKSESQVPAPQKPGSESDIDLESILGDSADSSAVDLGKVGQEPAPARSDRSKSAELLAGEVDEGELGSHPRLVGVEEDAEGAEVIEETALLDASDSAIAAESDEAELVTPKKAAATVAAMDLEADVHAPIEPVAIDDEHMAVDDEVVAVDDEPVALDDEPMAPTPVPSKKSGSPVKEPVSAGSAKRRELVGAGGGKRGGFMPFLLGGLVAATLTVGGGAAAWYFDALPDSPTAKKKPSFIPGLKGSGAAPAASTAEQARDLCDQGKYDDAWKLVEKADDKSPEAAVKGLLMYKKLTDELKGLPKADDPTVAKALTLIEGAGAKGVADDIRDKLKLGDDLAAKTAEVEGFGDLRKQLEQEKDKAVAQVESMKNATKDQDKTMKDLMAAKTQADDKLAVINDALSKAGIKDDGVKGIADLAVSRDALNTAVEAALKELKEGNLISPDGNPLQQLVEGAKKARSSGQSPLGSALGGMLGAFGGMAKAPADLFQKALDTTKLKAELAATKAQMAFAETPEQRCDMMIALLSDRGYTDAKELESFKRYIDWVRSKEAKTTPETRAKALYAEALILRNQDNVAGARQTLELAMKEADTAKSNSAWQKAASQALKEAADPANYYLPRVQSKIAAGQSKEAIEELTTALKAVPNSPQLLLKRAQIALDAALASGGKLDVAAQKQIREDAEAASKDPAVAAEAYYALGRLDEHNGAWAKAEENYRSAIKLAAGDQATRYRAALARVLQRDRGAGLPDLNETPEGDDDEELTATAETDLLVEEPAQQTGDITQDAAALKRLEESIKIAEDFINSPDPKTKGEGYMILGGAQARLGKMTEGLKNFVKGLRMVHPDWSTQELERIIANHPAFQQPDIALEPNPLMADRHFSKGLDFFWCRNYAAAETEFTKAISFSDDDARYRYFLGLTRHLQGTKDKRKLAAQDFEKGAQLEMARHPSTREVNASLERVQGDLRQLLNAYRERLQ